ncbi:hypothetical protein KCP71_00075 [Salmonella enterica subsp. enterica]|nr:hypothetical protein KCP71_00075 [Salmonella enterica subsp. enterica]
MAGEYLDGAKGRAENMAGGRRFRGEPDGISGRMGPLGKMMLWRRRAICPTRATLFQRCGEPTVATAYPGSTRNRMIKSTATNILFIHPVWRRENCRRDG